MPTKTNAARLLDRLAIRYELLTYPITKEHLPAEEIARRVGLPVAQVFKTLLAEDADGNHLFAVIPASLEVDLKALARLSNHRRTELVPLARVQPLTGYVRGGTTALAAKKNFPTFLDESALGQERMVVSAGKRGLQLALGPRDYVRATSAIVGKLSRAPSA